MTSILERSTTKYDSPGNYHSPAPSLDQLPPVEIPDASTAGQTFNSLVKTLTDSAERSGFQCDEDNLYLMGNIQEGHILFGREPQTEQTPAVTRLEVVDPSNKRFYYLGYETPVENGSEPLIDYKIHEETGFGSQTAAYSEQIGSPEADEATQLSLQLAETLVEVASTQHERGNITEKTLHDIVTPLTAPDVLASQSKRRFGGGVLNSWLSKVGINRTAA